MNYGIKLHRQKNPAILQYAAPQRFNKSWLDPPKVINTVDHHPLLAIEILQTL
jgi:hypothetical protein